MVAERVPLPDDPHQQQQEVMRRAHFAFETAFYNTLKILENPPRDDLRNFLGYCEAWCTTLVHHHDVEEAVMFPYLQAKLDFAKELEQHEKLHEALDAFLGQIMLAQKNPSLFDPAEMIQILKSAENNLVTHLHQEIEDLAPERLKVYTSQEIRDLSARVAKYAMQHANLALGLPFVRSHTPPEYKSWPPLPWAIETLCLPLLAMWHGGYWKYSPYKVN
ncbi:hypothetical protein V1506DRAFT_166353 [Lipomyces tetrasporus]